MLKLMDFKDVGYSVTRCDRTSPLEKDWATWLCQKRVHNKYYINVYISDIRLWRIDHTLYQCKPRSITIKIQLQRDNFTFDITISNDREYIDISDIELLVEEIWQQMDMNCMGEN